MVSYCTGHCQFPMHAQEINLHEPDTNYPMRLRTELRPMPIKAQPKQQTFYC